MEAAAERTGAILAFPLETTHASAATVDRPLLEALRGHARAAQRGARVDLEAGCPLVDPSAEHAFAAYAEALLRALDAASDRPLTFHPRRAAAVSFAEAWLLRLLGAMAAGDYASAAFLVARIVRRQRRGMVLWLARRAAETYAPHQAAAARAA